MTAAKQSKLDRAQSAMREATALVALATETVTSEQLDREKQFAAHAVKVAAQCSAFTMAYASDVPVPISFFKEWASKLRIRQWRDAGHLKLVLRNGKLTCTPSEFFDYYRTLKDEGGRWKK